MMDEIENSNLQQAEDLRLQGNAAFSSQDWATAVDRYQRSIDMDGVSKSSAKVYSNLAAALCKTSKYEEAHQAATKATQLDPGWAKAHWRLGVVLELQKDFMSSLKCYEKAVELDPNEPAYRVSVNKMLKRIGYQGEDTPDGLRIINPPSGGDGSKMKTLPLYIAWQRFKEATNDLTEMEKGFPVNFNPKEDYIKSEKWMAYGMLVVNIQMQLAQLSSQKDDMSFEEFNHRHIAITGCPAVRGDELQTLFDAVAFLNGEHISFETNGGKFVPSPKWLTWYLPQQLVAITRLLHDKTVLCIDKFDDQNITMSPSLFQNQQTYFANTGQPKSNWLSRGKEGSPQEVLDYCKTKLDEGITWSGGMREFVMFMYQGTVIHGILIRMMGQVSHAAKDFKWARTFIDLADAEWKVSILNSYVEFGPSFRKLSRVGILSAELTTVRTLRGDMPTVEEAEYEFNLCQEIITFVKNEPKPDMSSEVGAYNDWLIQAGMMRKPLANACCHLAGTMNSMLRNCNLRVDVIKRTGLTDYKRDDNLYSFLDESLKQAGGELPRSTSMLNSLIAETYKHAAMAQLEDADDTTILWWGYAAHLSQAGGYRVGELRRSINNALDSSSRRDKVLFGREIWEGSTYQQQSLLLANYYESKEDDFILPHLELRPQNDGSIALFVDGYNLCMNFDRNMRSELDRFESNRPDKKINAYMNTSEVEKEYGEER